MKENKITQHIEAILAPYMKSGDLHSDSSVTLGNEGQRIYIGLVTPIRRAASAELKANTRFFALTDELRAYAKSIEGALESVSHGTHPNGNVASFYIQLSQR